MYPATFYNAQVRKSTQIIILHPVKDFRLFLDFPLENQLWLYSHKGHSTDPWIFDHLVSNNTYKG